MTRAICLVLAAALALLSPGFAAALVHYDQGQVSIDGVLLLQTVENPNEYRYLAGDLTLARDIEDRPELLMAKIVGGGETTTGGILHALVRFGLPPERVEELQAGLDELRSGAIIVGPVQLSTSIGDEAARSGEEGSFQIVSAVLTDAPQGDRISGTVITSGVAPFSPGSKATLAARLTPAAADIMWENFTGTTADLSVAVRGYYEAQIEGYNAVVSAETETVYEHLSTIANLQRGYTRRQLRDISDTLIDERLISVEVFDRALGDIDDADMQKIVDVVTDKILDLYFDRETGWVRRPEAVDAVDPGQICGRQERGWFSKLFSGATDDPYCTDDQYVIKDIENVQRSRFVLNLSKRSTIMVPFDTAGNLGGFYEELDDEARARHFKIISLDDPARQEMTVEFQIDSAIVAAFGERLNLATVNYRRTRPDGTLDAGSLLFDALGVAAGETKQAVTFARLGDPRADWLQYEYQVAWSVSGLLDPLRVPEKNGFITRSDAGVQLAPPLERAVVSLDVDNTDFVEKGVHALNLVVASKLAGEVTVVAQRLVRADEAQPYAEKTILRDIDAPTVVQAIWHTRNGTIKAPLEQVEGDYHVVFTPTAEWFAERVGQ